MSKFIQKNKTYYHVITAGWSHSIAIFFNCINYIYFSGDQSSSQTWSNSSQNKARTTLPRRRTGFNAGALVPGSVSTMVSLPDSVDEQNSRTITSPSFQNVLDCDASSDYETDLEEDFPGKFIL